jgi:hypothetical protein
MIRMFLPLGLKDPDPYILTVGKKNLAFLLFCNYFKTFYLED